MIIPQIPILIDLAAVKRFLDLFRSAVNRVYEPFTIILKNPTYKFRLNIVGNRLYVEWAHRTTNPGQEKWVQYFNCNLASTGIPVYATNAAALAGGLIVGDFYRTGADPDPLCVVH